MSKISLKLLFILGSVFSSSVVFSQDLGEECRVRRGNRPGVCVYITDCPHVLYEFTTGLSITTCGTLNNKKVVCCANPKTRPADGTIPVPIDSTTTTSTPPPPKRTHEYKCREYQEAIKEETIVSTTFSKDDTKYQKCLHEKVPLIVGGENATAGEFPHMALLGYTVKGVVIWACGGSLISEKYVLTAGHCLEDYDYGNVTTVRLGELDYSTDTDKVKPEDFKVISRMAAPGYDFESKYNDIALLELDRIVRFTATLRPACLPSEDIHTKRFIATGWGVTSFSGNVSSILQKVVLDYFSLDQCLITYQPGTRELTNGVDIITQFCAGSEDKEKDACQGDSGGPMQDYHQHLFCMYTLYGITSFGQACATPGVPGMYTNIFSYVDWIEGIVWKESLLDVRNLN